MSDPLVTIDDLSVSYRARGTRKAATEVIAGLDLTIERGETLALVGESGSGKSTLAMAIARLAQLMSGSILYESEQLVGLKPRQRGHLRQDIQIVFQNAHTSLSPRRKIGWQLEEPLRIHTDLSQPERHERILEGVDELELGKDILDRYPHELSGGQAQRVVLARALVLTPSLILFDEPTSALDVSVQAGVLNLLERVKAEHSLTYLFITHDLAVARHIADRIAVMRSGEIVELGPTETVFNHPTNDYTAQLLDASLALRR